MLQPWPECGRETLADYRIFRIERVRRTSPRTGATLPFTLIRTHDWVNVIAFTPEGRIVLVRQFRHGTARFTLEIPGGVVHRGEEPLAAAARELREETGYVAGRLELLGSVNPNPALFTNRCATALALDCRRAGPVEPDAGEDLEPVVLDAGALRAAVRTGEVDHALVLAALTWLELAREERGGLPSILAPESR